MSKRTRLDSTANALRLRYGPQALRRASEIPRSLPPHLATGFAELDRATGCGGVPLGALTLLSGQATSGKTTVAYKTIAQLHQTHRRAVAALLDLNRSTDPDYLQRAGVDLTRLLVLRPERVAQATGVILDLARQQHVSLIVVDSLPDLLAQRQDASQVRKLMGPLVAALRETNHTVIFLHESAPAWMRWFNFDPGAFVRRWAALHVELRHEQWLTRGRKLVGYRGQARILKTRWGQGATAPVHIEFNGAIRARETW